MIVEYKRFHEGETVRKFRFTIGSFAYEKRRHRILEILRHKHLSICGQYRDNTFVYVPDFADAAVFFKEIK